MQYMSVGVQGEKTLDTLGIGWMAAEYSRIPGLAVREEAP